MLIDTRQQADASTQRRRPRSRLNPAKIRAGLRRRWFQRRLERTPVRDVEHLVQLGNPDYGGWVVPGDLIEPSWLCYSVGAGGETSFDLELVSRYGISVRSVEPVEEYVRRAIEDAQGDERVTVHRAAIATADGPLRMQLTHDPGSQSVSPAGLYDSHAFVELPGRTLPSLMSELGDTQIDLLKLDIEGGEYEVVPTLDLNALGVKVFAVQLHHTGTVRDAQRLVSGLVDQGFEPVAHHPAVKITFARRDLI